MKLKIIIKYLIIIIILIILNHYLKNYNKFMNTNNLF